MLRITIQGRDEHLELKLEGCLAGAWVEELAACWRATRPPMGGRIRVDLRGVCHVDDAGRDLMARMHLGGAAFVASGCVIPEVVREVTQSAAEAHPLGERT